MLDQYFASQRDVQALFLHHVESKIQTIDTILDSLTNKHQSDMGHVVVKPVFVVCE